MPAILTVTLKPGRDKSARRRHPWVYSGAIAEAPHKAEPGEIVRVVTCDGEFLAWGYYNPKSQIAVRLLEWEEKNAIEETWWREKISGAIKRRDSVLSAQNSACRLVFSEADFLPGLIIDRYDEFVVVQILTAGIERQRNQIVAIIQDALKPVGIFERSDSDARRLEGLQPRCQLLAGKTPPDKIMITENGHQFAVDIKSGQKTGFYLDQRDNRLLVSHYASGLDVLDCFSYSGGFSVYCLAANARAVTLVDSSASALMLATENIALGGFDPRQVKTAKADAFEYLRALIADGALFDMVILDPPPFASSRRHVERALAAYKDINLLALRLLKPDGLLVTFSCSAGVTLEMLKTVVAWSALDAGRAIQIMKVLSAGVDHPSLASFPESEYLKGLICRAL